MATSPVIRAGQGPTTLVTGLWLKRRHQPQSLHRQYRGILGRIQFDPHEIIQCALKSG